VTGTADSPDLVREKAWWAALSQGDGLRLPFAHIPPDSADLVADARTATVTAPADLTTALLGPANSAYATETVDLLLAGLARAARGLAGAGRLVVVLEGHGREAELSTLDVSRTVGWFTTLYPVAFDLDDTGDAGRQVRTVKDSLRAVPRRGVSYLALLDRPDGISEAPAQIAFNYLGRLELAEQRADGIGFELAPEEAGPAISPQARRPVPLEMLASVTDGRLHVTLTYNQRHANQGDITAFLDAYLSALADIGAHCLTTRGVTTASDLSWSGLADEDLDTLFDQ
jgi:non-ribosomal peptide synthase protein (TIGR01720 family)